MSDNKPPLFSENSLQIATKIIAIYAAFYMITAFVPTFTNPVSENPLMPQNHYHPAYFTVVVHLVIFLLSLWSILKKRFSWIIAGFCMVVVIFFRIFYNDIAIWVWSWS